MALLSSMFDATQVEPQTSFEPLPSGDYPVIIKDSEMKPNKAGTGEYLQLTLEVIDGPSKGRLVWDRLNLKNQNQMAEEIAQKQLSAICHATGVLNVGDSAQLHNIPMIAKVAYRAASGQYEASNDVKGYKAFKMQPQQQPAQQQTEKPLIVGQTPPWNNKAPF